MKVIKISESDQLKIFKIVAGVLHLGNIRFQAQGNYAQLEQSELLEYPSYLLNINKETLKKKLISRTIETKAGAQHEKIDVTLNVEQAEYSRDALAKGLYSRLFDYLVGVINNAMEIKQVGFEIS